MVHPGTVRLTVAAQLARVSGSMWVRNISLRPAVEISSYGTIRQFAILLWLAAAVWIIVPLARSAYGQGQRSIMLALAALIAIGTVIPKRLKEQIGSTLWPALPKTIIATPDLMTSRFFTLLPDLDIYKAGHLVLFAMLAAAALYRKPYPAVSGPRMAVYLLLFALVTEVVQLLAVGRYAQLGDILIDGVGLIAGFLLMRFVVAWRRTGRERGQA